VRYDATLDTPGARSDARTAKATPFRLYNLAEDQGETRDRGADYPDKAKELLAAWEDWSRQLPAPLWKPGAGAGAGTRAAAKAKVSD
jgi:hypothetical protein